VLDCSVQLQRAADEYVPSISLNVWSSSANVWSSSANVCSSSAAMPPSSCRGVVGACRLQQQALCVQRPQVSRRSHETHLQRPQVQRRFSAAVFSHMWRNCSRKRVKWARVCEAAAAAGGWGLGAGGGGGGRGGGTVDVIAHKSNGCGVCAIAHEPGQLQPMVMNCAHPHVALGVIARESNSWCNCTLII